MRLEAIITDGSEYFFAPDDKARLNQYAKAHRGQRVVFFMLSEEEAATKEQNGYFWVLCEFAAKAGYQWHTEYEFYEQIVLPHLSYFEDSNGDMKSYRWSAIKSRKKKSEIIDRVIYYLVSNGFENIPDAEEYKKKMAAMRKIW